MSTPATEGNTEPTAEQLWKEVAADREAPSDETHKPETTQQEAVVPTNPVAPAPATTPAQVDPFEGLSPAVVDKLKQLDTLALSLRQAHTNIGNLVQQNKSLTQQVADAKSAIPATAPAATASQVAAATKTPEKWNQFKKDYPELAEAMEDRWGADANAAPPPDLTALRSQIQEELEATITTKLSKSVREEIAAETEARLLNAAHRNWTETVKTPAFVEWQKAQPKEIQDLGASPRAEDAMQMLDLFKAQQGPATPAVDPGKVIADRQARLKEAASLTRGTGAMEPVKSPDDMTATELWAYEADQRKKRDAARR